SVFGVHLSMGHIPLGTYTIPSRTGDLPAAVASAGAIASSRGSAIAPPIPRKKLRRGTAFLKIIMARYTSLFGLQHRQTHRLAMASDFSCDVRISKGALLTIPRIIDDQR